MSGEGRKWEIYTLSDPRDGTVRYVGVTHCGKRRFLDHIREAKCNPQTRKSKWIQSLLDCASKPVLEVVESGTGLAWRNAERNWIKAYRAQGDLTNISDGGDGAFWGRHNPPVTPEYRARLSAAMKGKVFSAEHRANISISAKRRGMPPSTPERRAKQSAALKGKPVGPYSPERVAACKAGRKDYHHSPETKAKMRAVWASAEYRAKMAAAIKVAVRKPRSETPMSSDQRAKISAALKGRKVDPAVLAARIGRKHSPEHCARIGDAHRGRKDSAETRQKKSHVRMGMKFTAEHIANMTAARRKESAIRKQKKNGGTIP